MLAMNETKGLRMPRPRKLPARAQVVVMPMILSFLMSGIVSAISTLRVVGFAADTHWRILEAWSVSYVVAFPVALVVLPIVRRIVGLLVETHPLPQAPQGAGRPGRTQVAGPVAGPVAGMATAAAPIACARPSQTSP